MKKYRPLFNIISMVIIIIFLNITNVFSMQKATPAQTPSAAKTQTAQTPVATPTQPPTTPIQKGTQPPTAQSTPQEQLEDLRKKVTPIIKFAENLFETTQRIVQSLNESLTIAHRSNDKSITAFQSATQALETATHASKLVTEILSEKENFQTSVQQQIQAATKKLEHDYQKLSTALTEQTAKEEQIIIAAARRENGGSLEDKIKIEEAKIEAKQQHGIYEQEAKIMAQVPVAIEKEKWTNIQKIIDNSKPIIKISLAIIATTMCFYAIKYGIPVLTNYLTQPCVISETSQCSWLEMLTTKKTPAIDDLVFAPDLQKQLLDLLLRVQSAKSYNESLPNLLFYGASGTGKTAFVKMLAYTSGLDYALTSGSEFAKITDLNNANNELRKLLNWAKKSSKGLIIFIDEAESLFANRKLPTTSKATQDFINTFLALISDQSQKNVMFIFATNHPFKLDDAITNRIGINIEFTLPQASEREKILSIYLVKFAQENEKMMVDFHPEFTSMLSKYADSLEGFSPRAIKFVAEEMVVKARRQKFRLLTNEIAQETIDETKHSLQQTITWEMERNELTKGIAAPKMQYKGWFQCD